MSRAFFFAYDLQETKESRAAMSELQDSWGKIHFGGFNDANGYVWFPNACMKTTMIRKHQPKELADHSPRLPPWISDTNGLGTVF